MMGVYTNRTFTYTFPAVFLCADFDTFMIHIAYLLCGLGRLIVLNGSRVKTTLQSLR